MPDEDKDLPNPDDLGEGPESRMENFPPKPAVPEGPIGAPPGVPKPKAADAVGDNDTEELVEEMEDDDLRVREDNTQKDNIRVEKNAPPPDPRRRPPDPHPGTPD